MELTVAILIALAVGITVFILHQRTKRRDSAGMGGRNKDAPDLNKK